jgi:rubrerythrin
MKISVSSFLMLNRLPVVIARVIFVLRWNNYERHTNTNQNKSTLIDPEETVIRCTTKESKMTEHTFNLKEIIEMAIQIETAGAAFYKRLTELAETSETRDLFKYLEDAEYQHIHDFEAVLKSALSRQGQLEYSATEEDLLYLRAFASRRIFTSTQDAVNKAEALKGPIEAIDMALDFELKSVGFYKEMSELIEDPADSASVRELEKQEKSHAAYLYKIREQLLESS